MAVVGRIGVLGAVVSLENKRLFLIGRLSATRISFSCSFKGVKPELSFERSIVCWSFGPKSKLML